MGFSQQVILYICIPVFVLLGGITWIAYDTLPNVWSKEKGYPTLRGDDTTETVADHYVKVQRLESNVQAKEQELQLAKIAQAERLKNSVPPEKEIYETKGLSFGADASFAPLFENVISAARGSGIRIRSIAQTERPGADTIVASGLPGYNVLEVDIVAVGTYSEFQAFYKNVLREYYLTYFAEIEVKPWELDKSVLISTIKLRLYTKT